MKALVKWLDHRTGIADLLHAALYEHVPGGARWRYVWGSTLVFAFTVQAITGVFLWMSYAPSSQTAWESVYYIQHEMQGGWLLRGIHHFMAQAMVVLLALHLMQVVIDGAYRAPREVNFWLGLMLMQIVLGLSLTGYLLPWDQKGYWATIVATNIASIVPGVGEQLQRLIVGGPEYGHHTLTRFFALHAGVLPGALVGFLVLHVALFRRHGLHAKQPLKGEHGSFWPDQVLKDAVACLAVLAVVLFLTILPGLGSEQGIANLLVSDKAGDVLGAELGAPADGATPYSAARPEWYFLFLFQFLKLFESNPETGELIGGIIIPGAVMGLLFLMPFLGRWKLGHRFNVGLLLCLLIGVTILTGQAMWADRQSRWIAEPSPDNEKAHERWTLSRDYLEAVEHAEAASRRAVELARGLEIPPTGALSLLRSDAKTRGPELFEQHCAACHTHVDPARESQQIEKSTAPDLFGFASRAWIAGLLDPDKIASDRYFGHTAHKEGDMVGFVQGDEFKALSDTQRHDVVVALSAESKLPAQATVDAKDAATITAGAALIKETAGCTNCHHFHDAGDLGAAPDLTGFGSREWLIGMISNPGHERFYGDKNDRMPEFAAGDDPTQHRLTAEELSLLADWLRGEWFVPAAGAADASESATASAE
ncbi:MAG TPA: cytochrome b N-terminal domain-containing protein [Pirellulales bacterium]|nr:cytochrome b N-terminal domain-containing protein [Pirellulales bacterium]